MSDLEWKIEDGALVVWEDFGEATWRRAFADEAATILQSVIASTKEQCAMVAEARAAEGEYGTWQAQEGLIIASAIRFLQITGEGK